ncbi:hypothetical protein EDB19DRAFT_1681653 [Suillus lakei]|nr:hypothetical protein EDB19DRAFT_1681653 [Suillus lakei]
MSSKWPQCGTGRLYLLLRLRHKKHSNKASRTARGRPRHRLLQVLILPRHDQAIRIHYPSDYWLISRFSSAAHILNTSMATHSKHSSNKANRKVKCRHVRHRCKHSSSKVKSRPRRHHRRLSPPLPRRSRHILLLLLVLSHQVERLYSHDLFHYGLASCCFFVVHLPHTPMVINTGATYIQLSHLCF